MFSKERKAKQLTLREIHDLYKLLESSLPEQEEEFLISQIEKMLEKITPQIFISSLELMYGKIEGVSDIGLAVLFIKGLKENLFFEYANIIKRLKNGRRTSKN